jgi:hypothetical protein
MAETFAGVVQIQDEREPPVVQIVLSGHQGTARFGTGKIDSPATTVSNREISIGTKLRKSSPTLTPHLPIAVGDSIDFHFPQSGEVAVDTSREPKSALTIGDEDLAGGLFIIDAKGKQAFRLNGVTASLTIGAQDNAGEIYLLDSTGEIRIRLDGNAGDIELLGADCAEEFDVEGPAAVVDPGTVMVIGEAGGLRPSDRAYDKRVAGIISGAGGFRPGIVLHKQSTRKSRLPLALTGKTYCKVDATYGSVEIGDLLTTSDTPGHAMRAADPLRASGTVVGKALRPLSSGRGLIPVLIALQ